MLGFLMWLAIGVVFGIVWFVLTIVTMPGTEKTRGHWLWVLCFPFTLYGGVLYCGYNMIASLF